MSYKVDSSGFNGAITLLFSERGLSLELHDRASSARFVEINLDPQQTVELLSRRSHTPCHIEFAGLDRIGKTMLMDKLEFELPEGKYDNRKLAAKAEADRLCPDGWEHDNYFSSQDSFFRKDGKDYARVTIRKWELQPSRDSGESV